VSDFNHFDLDKRILQVLQEIGYEKPTSIQEQAIPKILSGVDLIASAQTGTGKTGAFMLPVLHLLTLQKETNPQILVLVPTRELAIQVADEAKKYTKYLPFLKTVCIYGGVPYPVQKRSLARRHDILVATPGRLIDYIEQKKVDLSKIKCLILDEADRMLDMGFVDAVERIVASLPAQRQTLLFSATIDGKILPLSKRLQNNPHQIRVKPDLSTANNIEQQLYYVDGLSHKMRLLDHILENTAIHQMIVFTSTINQTQELADYLKEKGYFTGVLNGNMHQRQRTKTISKLRDGDIQILVATDVAARGIDISSLSHVINFDMPFQAEDFVHRIGRTGRAGAKGVAITFATYREEPMMLKIQQLMGKTVASSIIAGLEPKPKAKGDSRQKPYPRSSARFKNNRSPKNAQTARKPSYKARTR
jgi:superfamily II DNA/RNA helicase